MAVVQYMKKFCGALPVAERYSHASAAFNHGVFERHPFGFSRNIRYFIMRNFFAAYSNRSAEKSFFAKIPRVSAHLCGYCAVERARTAAALNVSGNHNARFHSRAGVYIARQTVGCGNVARFAPFLRPFLFF